VVNHALKHLDLPPLPSKPSSKQTQSGTASLQVFEIATHVHYSFMVLLEK
jgi:hypothetical protein